jgi:hypothetical protein
MNHRASNPTQRVTPNPASRTGMRSRPITNLRTINETAELLNVSPRTVRRLIDSGEAGGAWMARCPAHEDRQPSSRKHKSDAEATAAHE